MSGVVRLYAQGGPEVLRYESEEVGEPGPGQVRLRQEAIGVNFVDTYFRAGAFPLADLPAVIGVEGAGIVDAVGPGVTSVAVGDRAGYYFALGAYAEQRLIAADDLVPLPDDVSAGEAATLLAKGLTAWARVHRVHPVRAGEVVVVTGATGGVGYLIAAWAQHLGATVIAVVAAPEGREALRTLGLKQVVVAGTGELAAEVAAAGGKVDVLYDQVGQATFGEVTAVLGDGSLLDLLGAASGAPDVDAADLARRGVRVTQSPTSSHLPDRAAVLAAAAEVFDARRAGVFWHRPVRSYALSEAATAHRDVEARTAGPAVVLVPDA